METACKYRSPDLSIVFMILGVLSLGAFVDSVRVRTHIKEDKETLTRIEAKLDRCVAERESPTGDDDSAEETAPPTTPAK